MLPAVLPLLMLLPKAEWASPPRRNHAPIVLVGGFTNWGREELLGFKYWGGKGRDIQEDLVSRDFETVTAAVGPLSSNWDRACEAFAILRGGRVDYGKAHAERHGHARFGRTYPGLLKTWGEPGPAGPMKVHLVGHSQGGQTARTLTHLLAEGDATERAATAADELSALFQGGHAWVLSVTSLSTPHDGTTLVYHSQGLVNPARKLLALIANLPSRKNQPVYDLKLDQWGLQRQEGEGLKAFSERIFAGPLWKGTRDFSAWDLSPEGARDLNGWVKASPQVFYFSWSTAKTLSDHEGHQIPAPKMTFLWRDGARFMGRTLRSGDGQVGIDASWWRNDGAVNTRSMAGPSTDTRTTFDGTPRRGIWNHMGVLEGWDHSEILGIGPEHGGEVLTFYRRWASFLAGLEE